MVLTNTEIIQHINNSNMIEFHSSNCIKNCSYKIRIGEIIEPQSGTILQLNGNGYFLKPSEVVIIKSKEKLHIPEKITASYSALFSISSKGLLLINSSMIEPGYSGYVSAVLLNFSAQPVLISIGDEIAKVTFFKLGQIPHNISREIITDSTYINNLRVNATKYHKSFLNISGLEKTITEKVIGETKSLITKSGYIIAFLILFATLEPLFSKWIWEKPAAFTTTERANLEITLQEINQSKKEIEKTYKDLNKLVNLQQQIDSIKRATKITK